MPGFTRGRELDKMGCKVQDTAELSFVDVRVPAANVLGEVDEVFGYLGHNLPQERLTVAVGSVSQDALGDRRGDRLHQGPQGLRGRPSPRSRTPSSNSPLVRRKVEAAQAMLDRAISLHVDGELSGP